MIRKRKRSGAIFLSTVLLVTQLPGAAMAENGRIGDLTNFAAGGKTDIWETAGILDGDHIEGGNIDVLATPSEADITDKPADIPTEVPADNPHAITITGWEFVDDDFLTEGELALPGVNIEQQADFDTVVSMLPKRIRVETDRDGSGQKEADLETLSIDGWNCSEYIRDGEGNWPLTGEYMFTAELPDGYACDPLPEVTVILGGISVMTINDRYAVDGLLYKRPDRKAYS